MFIILEIQGCLPYINIILDDIAIETGTDEVKLFNTKEEAEAYAKENCAFEYRLVEV